MAFSNSPLVTYKNLTKDYSTRKNKIDTITIHCYVGQVTAKKGCDYFATSSRQVSSNYVVGHDGSIGLSVEEKNRAWTSGGSDIYGNPIRVNGISGADNDHRAVTIEVACDPTEPYAVTDEAYKALIELVADICKRNNIKELKWKGDKKLVDKISEQNMTVHRWFSNTACPGDFLYSKMGDIANKVNAKLNTKEETKVETPANTTKPTTAKKVLYRVRKTWKDSASQLGAFSSLPNAKKLADANPGYKVFDDKGKAVYTPKTTTTKKVVKEGSKVKIKKGAKSYEGISMDSWVYTKVFRVDELNGKRAVLDRKGICTAFHIDNLIVQ